MGRKGALQGLAAAVLVVLASHAAPAQSVPLPRPSPVPKTQGAAPPRPPQATAPGTQQALNIRPGETIGSRSPLSGPLTPEQRELAARVSAYLSSIQTLTGNFVQIAPNGARSTGQFYIQKPGRVRFEYDPPTPISIVADGSSMVVRDTKLATQDLYPLSQTPLRFLLSDTIDLTRDTNLVGLYADDMFITVIIEERNAVIGKSRLMLMIGTKDMQLKQWTVTDPQGFDTTVAVSNLDTGKPLDPSLFKIDYTDYGNRFAR